MIHRSYFFDSVRAALFGGALTQDQVDGLTVLLDYGDAAGWDDRWLAYVLATAYHETARTMQPIAEYGHGQGHSYGVADPETGQAYYGRGFVQLTWRENYQTMQDTLAGAPALVANADLALESGIATQVIFRGMEGGLFTGKQLSDWLTADATNFYDARTIVNGHDCAGDIATYATKFADAITHTAQPRAAVDDRSPTHG